MLLSKLVFLDIANRNKIIGFNGVSDLMHLIYIVGKAHDDRERQVEIANKNAIKLRKKSIKSLIDKAKGLEDRDMIDAIYKEVVGLTNELNDFVSEA